MNKDGQTELETEYGVEFIAKFLEETKNPRNIIDLRNCFKITKERFDMLLDLLIKKELLKIIVMPIIVITPKGQEFLKRYKRLIKILEEPICDFSE
jgi:predicted transcriptional regulator